MCKIRIAVCVLISLGFALSCSISNLDNPKTVNQKVSTSYDTTGYTLIWSDEFNGSSVDQSKWNFDTGNGTQGWGNWELEYYQAANAVVSGGVLSLTAKKESAGGFAYTSARLNTLNKFSFQYGKAVARIKCASGQGFWNTFWMMGTSGAWPKCGEVDILENINVSNTMISAAHWWADSINSRGDYGGYDYSGDQNGFHDYEVEWDSSSIRTRVDGTQYFAIDITPADLSEFRQQFYLLLSLAVGGVYPGSPNSSTPFPASMQVDYVRVYQKGVDNTAAGFKVVGYMPSWEGDVNVIQYSKLTHINYSFAIPNSDGTLQAIDNPSKLTSMVSQAHAKGVKVLISVGGWLNGNPAPFQNIANGGLSQNFANNILNFINQYGLDGVDIDWEFPRSVDNFTGMMQALYNTMHANGKLCTAAFQAGSYGGDGISSSSFPYIDFVNLMAYEGGNGAANSPYSLAQSCISYWQGRGLSKDKMILGVPFYGKDNSGNLCSYAGIVYADSTAPNKDQSGIWYYNGIATIQAKTVLAQSSCNGVSIWELAEDTSDGTSLLSAINSQLAGSTGATSIVSGGIYELVSVCSGKALDVNGASSAAGAKVQQWTRNNSSAQKWTISDMGNGLKLTAQCSGMALDCTGATGANATPVEQWNDNGGPWQRWGCALYGTYWKFWTVQSGARCLDVSGASASDGAQIQLWDDNGSAAQRWILYKK
jgi:chitinase